jgi:hypothetical protein
MPANLEFFPDRHTIVFTIDSPWVIEDLFAIYPEADKIFNSAAEKLTTIVDIRHIGRIPPGAMRARRSPFMVSPRSGFQILVSQQNHARSMAEIVYRIANYKRVRFCNTMEQAWALVQGENTRVEKHDADDTAMDQRAER